MSRHSNLALLCAASLVLVACGNDAASAAGTPPVVSEVPTVEAPEPTDAAGKRIADDTRRLADDAMQGRETGTKGHDLAAAFVAARFAAIGLAPAGDGKTYFQRVPLLKSTVVRDGARFAIQRGGRTLELRFAEQFLPWSSFDVPAHSVEGEAVFVGHAISAPDIGHDDFAGVDLTGKIAVVLPGAPSTFDDQHRAFHSAQREKLAELAKRGAVGVVFVSTPQYEARVPWARVSASWDKPAMQLRGADDRAADGFPQLRAAASVGVAAADFVFADLDRSAAQLFDAADAGTLKPFALPGRIALAGRSRIERIESRNVVGRLPGSDPALAAQTVVHTAHLDHVGFGPADAKGDRLHNGAIDNALGVAILIETARTLHDAPTAPKRSQLFVALTGEEQGLLGATWFVRQPTVARDGIVANLNVDMPVLLAPSKDIVAVGSEHSSLQAAAQATADALGVGLSPDPFPEEVTFIRSDQYAFVRAGIPALFVQGGAVSADGERDPLKSLTWYLRNCYHQPCDDASLPIHYDDAARMARFLAGVATRVGDDPKRPTWNDGDFFGGKFRVPAR